VTLLLSLRLAIRVMVVLALVAGVARAQYAGAAGRAGVSVARSVPGALAGLPTVAEGKPEVRYERVAGEVIAGTYAGVAGYFVGRGIGTVATSMMSEEQDRLREQIVNGVGMVGGSFAIGGAVYAIGNMGAEAGSFPTTMGGVAIGAVASFAISHLVFHGIMPADPGSARRKWWVATLECSLPAIGGTIAFNQSRRWQR
jgi:hypothetical protein